MKNFIQPGKSIDFTVPAGGVISGNIVVIGSLIGVSAVTAAEGESATMETEGVYDLNKVSAQAWATQGLKIYWDGAAKLATTTATGNTLIGISVAAAANPSATGLVKLGPTTV